jgi:hypothetical protein
LGGDPGSMADGTLRANYHRGDCILLSDYRRTQYNLTTVHRDLVTLVIMERAEAS